MKALLLAAVASCGCAQLPDVQEIMRRVAFNQAKTQDARLDFVYHQKQNVRLRRSNGKVAREEFREYDITPGARGLHRELVSVQGRYEKMAITWCTTRHKKKRTASMPGWSKASRRI